MSTRKSGTTRSAWPRRTTPSLSATSSSARPASPFRTQSTPRPRPFFSGRSAPSLPCASTKKQVSRVARGAFQCRGAPRPPPSHLRAPVFFFALGMLRDALRIALEYVPSQVPIIRALLGEEEGDATLKMEEVRLDKRQSWPRGLTVLLVYGAWRRAHGATASCILMPLGFNSLGAQMRGPG